MTDWNKIGDDALPVHCNLGLTAEGQGPVSDLHPDFDHWGCWCSDPERPGPPTE